MKRTAEFFVFVFIFILFASARAFAVNSSYAGNFTSPDLQSGVQQEQYEIRVASKLQRGLENFVLSPLEIFHGVKTAIHSREEEYLPVGIETVFIGMFRGIGNMFIRGGVGFYETFTCVFPQKPILEDMDDWLY